MATNVPPAVNMTAVAESWRSRTYVVKEGLNARCEIRLPALPFGGGTIVVKGERFAIARAGLFWSEFRFVRSGQTLARAEATPSWRMALRAVVDPLSGAQSPYRVIDRILTRLRRRIPDKIGDVCWRRGDSGPAGFPYIVLDP